MSFVTPQKRSQEYSQACPETPFKKYRDAPFLLYVNSEFKPFPTLSCKNLPERNILSFDKNEFNEDNLNEDYLFGNKIPFKSFSFFSLHVVVSHIYDKETNPIKLNTLVFRNKGKSFEINDVLEHYSDKLKLSNPFSYIELCNDGTNLLILFKLFNENIYLARVDSDYLLINKVMYIK